MIFNAAKVMKIEKAINLFDRKGKLVNHLDIGRHPLHFDSSELFITSALDGDLFGREPFTKARPLTTISGVLAPRNLNLSCFAESAFLGEVKRFTFYCNEGDDYHLTARIWKPEAGIVTENSLDIHAHFPKEMFREVFHPIWIRQAKSRLSVTLNVVGYQMGVEAAFGEPGDTDNIVVEAAADIDAKLSAVRLTTQLQ